MSLEQNIQKLKDEAVAEEKFLESFLRIEKWWIRFKTPIIVAAVALVFGTAGYLISQWVQEAQKKENYALYQSLLNDSENEQKLLALKQSGSPLYDMFLLRRAVERNDIAALESLQNSQESFLGMIARYQAATLGGDLQSLDALKDVDAMLAEMALLQRAYLLLKADDIAQAHGLLATIPLDSPLRGIAQFFEHYGITKVVVPQAQETQIPDGIELLTPDVSPQSNTAVEGIELFNGAKVQPKD